MKRWIAALATTIFATGFAVAQAPAAPAAPSAPVATPVHKKAAASSKYKKAPNKKVRAKKAAASS